MQRLITWLNNSFAPKMSKINNNVWITTIKDSIMQVLPMILLGSLFAMLAILNDYFPSLPSFWTPFGYTMGFISIFIAFLIPFNLMEKKKLRKMRIVAGMAGLALFFIILKPESTDAGMVFASDGFGAGGMFVAMIAGIYSGIVMSLFGKFSFFKENSVIPDFVRSWFDTMLPIALIIVTGWVFVNILDLNVYNIILAIFMPLKNVIETPWGFSLMMFIYCFLYSMGISTWVLTPVTKPVLLAAIAANVAAIVAGGAATHIVTSETIYSAYMWIGGTGATLPLVLMFMASKSKKLKALGTASLVPGIFNINEPIVFGAIAWNPILMIPMWLQGLVLPIIVWFSCKTFAPIPARVFDLWYMPFPVGTILLAGLTGLILLAITTTVSTLIWYPFFRVYEKQEMLTNEAE